MYNRSLHPSVGRNESDGADDGLLVVALGAEDGSSVASTGGLKSMFAAGDGVGAAVGRGVGIGVGLGVGRGVGSGVGPGVGAGVG